MKNIIQLKLFVSSPSDVQKERDFSERIIKDINENEGLNDSFHVHIYRWENKFVTDWGKYQKQINKELEDTDIYLGILWNKFGSPTDNYLSGTEDEFRCACDLVKNGEKIELCFYRCTNNGELNLNDSEQLEQKQRVNNFFNDYNNNIFSSTNYNDALKFENRFRADILKKIRSILGNINDSRNRIGAIIKSFNNNGITKLYTPELNSSRNQDKIDFLKNEEGDICLLAHSGNSYLHTSEDGNPGRFFKHLKRRLNSQPNKVKVLLLNPYSLEARKIFYAENFNLYQNDISSIKDTSVLEKGKNFLRFEKCLQGIDEIKRELRDNSDRLEVRISNVATDGTILMSNGRLFFEPYVSSRFLNRIEEGLNLFEIQVQNLLNKRQCSSIFNKHICQVCDDKVNCSDNLYKTLAEQFYILWATSISLAEYRGQGHKYKEDFSESQPELFHKQIVQLHDSWLAFDPIIGCKGNCIYCFLGPQGWRGSTPQLRKHPNGDSSDFLDNAYNSLCNFKFLKTNGYNRELLGDIPISIGNKTDMLSVKNKENLKYILDLHEKKNGKRPLVLITKQIIDLEVIGIIKNYSFDVNIFFSISFLPKEFESNVPLYKERLKSAKEVKEKINTEGITNINLIHYWRPIINFIEEELDTIIEQLKSNFDCSICVGLKINSDIFKAIENDNSKLYNYVSQKGIDNIENGFEIFEPSFEKLTEVAKSYNYPIFKHTSCALSYVQGKVDYNGTMWRENFCNDCVEEQKNRCESYKENWNADNYLSLLNIHVGSNYKVWEDCIEIVDSTISQEKTNYLTHLIGKPVFAESIRFSLVWPSSNQIYFMTKYSEKDEVEVVKREYPTLTKQLDRLKGITGFISILGNDRRAEVFNRYDHVNRVVRLLKWYIHVLKDIDIKKCVFLGLFHDINRLPFAHNLEKEINFSQAETIHNYMALFEINIDNSYYIDFKSFFNKELHGSIESRITYLIDAVEGFIEDPLFAFITLGVDHKSISQEILLILGFEDTAKLEQCIKRLKELYNNDIAQFRKEFDGVVFEYAKEFIIKHKKDNYKIFTDDDFINIRNKIKKELMINQIFPINNEAVSKGSDLAKKIGIPYIEYLKSKNKDVFTTLFKQTDKDLLKATVSEGIITDEKIYYPNLNL